MFDSAGPAEWGGMGIILGFAAGYNNNIRIAQRGGPNARRTAHARDTIVKDTVLPIAESNSRSFYALPSQPFSSWGRKRPSMVSKWLQRGSRSATLKRIIIIRRVDYY